MNTLSVIKVWKEHMNGTVTFGEFDEVISKNSAKSLGSVGE